MVCRRTIFYRQYFKGTHGKTNDSGRIYFWPWRHIYELYYPRQLQLGLQVFGKLDVIGLYTATGNLYTTIIAIVRTLPLAPLVLILLALTMIAFYATSFDAIALVASSYSYKELDNDEEPHMGIKVFWSIMLILLPIALVFSDNSMANLQTVSIIAAFPIAVIIVMIIVSFFKDAKKML